MKFGTALLALASASSVSAFAPPAMHTARMTSASSTTGSTTAATAVATSFEEDLALTLAVIMDHERRSTTVSKEQMLSQMKEAEKVDQEPAPEPVDISIPYNAAAMLAYQAAGSKGDFASFEAKYLEETVAMVTAKKAQRDGAAAPAAAPKKKKQQEEEPPQVVDLSIPYDAAAKLAYEAASDKKQSFEEFKADYEAQAVATVIAKRNDISIPYDAAAALAFMQSNRKMPYATFKAQYEADARSAVMAKNDLSVNYDSAALMEYVASDRSVSFEDFKAKYQADAIAQVIAKKQARDEAA